MKFRRPTHPFICSETCAGRFQIQRKTRADRMRAKLQEIKQEMRRRMHQPILEDGRWLERVVRGYFNYHAVPTNGQALEGFRQERGPRGMRASKARTGRRAGQTCHRRRNAYVSPGINSSRTVNA